MSLPWHLLEALGASSLASLLTRGGPAMRAVFLADLALWGLLVERYLTLRRASPLTPREAPDAPAALGTDPWSAWGQQARNREERSRQRRALRRGLPLARALVTLLPLLGLLGTVLGMQEVFRGLQGLQTPTPRALAGGISQATLSTLAGLLSALVALPVLHSLEGRARSLEGPGTPPPGEPSPPSLPPPPQLVPREEAACA